MEFLYVEKTELIYTNMNQPNPPTHNIPYDTVTTIFHGIRTKKMLFGLIKKPEKYISIRSAKGNFDITEKDVDAPVFERYLEELKEFAHRHHVTIRESTGDTKDDWRL